MQRLDFLKKMSAIVLMIALMVGGSLTGRASAAELPRSKKTIAVIEFAVRGNSLDPHAGAIIADSLTSAIANMGNFALKDRISLNAIAKLAKKNPLGSIGPVDSETAIQLGTIYGIHGVVTGTVSKLGDRVMVTARLIDTRTGTVARSGEIQAQDIDAVQVKLDQLAMSITTAPATITQPAHPPLRSLTVKTEPVGATVQLLNVSQPYQAGIRLASGIYEVEVSHPSYVTQKVNATLGDNDVNLLVSLEKRLYTLTIEVEPPQARISILNLKKLYQPGMKLGTGVYQIEVAYPGYQTIRKNVTILDADLNMVLSLEPQKTATVTTQNSSTKNNRPRKNAVSTNRDQTARNPPPPEGNAFKRGFRNFRNDFKRAFW
ncbi:MAG: hypothetical protein IT491_07720 [Gammaproteobacteria bacterium]|jgi:TolB-like protein|nr:hypothetical protein [Gammaproteobacteria bacterium]